LKSFHNWLVPKSIYCRVRHTGDDARRPPKMWCILCCVPESKKTEVATQSRVDSFSAVLMVKCSCRVTTCHTDGSSLRHCLCSLLSQQCTARRGYSGEAEWCAEAMCSFASLAMTPDMVVWCHLHGTTEMLSKVSRRIGPGPKGIEERLP
jgi:hypothetical protein